ncbi:MAG: PcfJ domain-containing protein [Myxococcota bacterium]
MAKRRRRARLRPRLAVPHRVAKHIERLGLYDAADYLAWCRARGFRACVQKSFAELEQEWCVHGRDLVRARFRYRKDRKPGRMIADVCAGRAVAGDLARPRWRSLAERIERARLAPAARRALRTLVEICDRKGDLLLAEGVFGHAHYAFVDGLIGLSRHHRSWLRSPQAWCVRTHNARRQFASLSRHLLARYPVPAFLDAAWLRDDRAAGAYRDWFVRVGNGRSLRRVAAPITLSHRIVHHFLGAPEHYSIEQALRRGQIRASGGDDRLVDAVAGTRLGDHFQHEAFWATVLAFLARNPELDSSQVGPIVDYLHHQRFVERDVFVARGERRRLPAPQPHLSMKGRRLSVLLRQVARWHRELARSGPGASIRWKPSGIGALDFETGVPGKSLRVWRIRELLSASELRREGSVLRHCVASYAGACASGSASIWTMELWSFEGVQKRQTIEVSPNRVIVQCRGRFNRDPNEQERQMLSRWAQQEMLTISRFVATA